MLLPPTDPCQNIFAFLFRVAFRSLLLQEYQPMALRKQVKEVQKIPKAPEHKGTKSFGASMLQYLSVFKRK